MTPADKVAILRADDPDRCECGTPIDGHPDLPKPPPLMSAVGERIAAIRTAPPPMPHQGMVITPRRQEHDRW